MSYTRISPRLIKNSIRLGKDGSPIREVQQEKPKSKEDKIKELEEQLKKLKESQ